MLLRRSLALVLASALLPLALTGCECDSTDDPDAGDAMLPDAGPPVDGGTVDGGGGETGPIITICPGDALPALASGDICEATAGDDNLLITGDILTPGEVFRGGQVLVDATGSIACVGCDCSGEAGASGASTVVCPDGVVSPGLINAHEHITYQAEPAVATDERYEHRNDWRSPERGHTRIRNGGDTDEAATIQWDELRMIMAGVTSVNGSGSADGLVRNLDVASDHEGLDQGRIDYDTFPLGDIDGEQLATGCDYPSLPSATDAAGEDAYTPHIAEGIDAESRNEFLCMREGASDVIEGNVAIIHGIGLLAPDIAEMADEQTSLIWSPRTNISLYGDTARVTLYDNLGVLIAMGTDWQRSGSMNMLRELQCADELNQDYFDGHFTDEQLWLMATRNGAAAASMEDAIGTLAVGLVADIAIYDGSMNGDHRAVIEAEPESVALTLRGGTVLYGEAAVLDVLASGCDSIDVCGAPRAACLTDEVGVGFEALQAASMADLEMREPTQEFYPLFYCDVTPRDEPTCRPERDAMDPLPSPTVDGSNRYTGMLTADDMDGDGIANAEDICARIFNPIRPLDMGTQADFDEDGLGDECDPCPLDADTTTCTTVDPNDRDRDMVVDTADNCPEAPNMDQADLDGDGTGDVCDACPQEANPGGTACPATIYDVKDGTLTEGGRVFISQSVVTAVTTNGFAMQVPTDHPEYDGADFSGVFVYTGAAPMLDGEAIERGDTVDVVGTLTNYEGQIQVGSPTVTASATPSASPAATIAEPADVDTGGSRAAALEAVLVEVQDVAVTDPAPAPTETDGSAEGEFEVDASLRVDDFYFRIEPFVMTGENFEAIRGVLELRDTRHKLMPRDADDYVAGAPQLAAIEPALTYVRLGDASGPTFPAPLTVRLTRAAAEATVVTITSADLTVADVTVPMGSSSVTVPVEAPSALTPGPYTVTAMLGTTSFDAMVRVLAADEVPASFTVTPSPATIASSGTQSFVVTLDIPAPPGGITIALAEDAGGTLPDPAEVVVAEDQQSATFDYVAPVGPDTGTLTATMDEGTPVVVTVDLTIEPPRPGTLLINEVDYDLVGTDTGAEYVELYNPGTTAVTLAGKELILVNQTGTLYEMIDLSSAGAELAPGGFLVVRAPGMAVASGALTVDLPGPTDNIQNGERDGMFVYDSTAMEVLDTFGYEGETMTTIDGMTVVMSSSLADNSSSVGAHSRIPDGAEGAADDVFVFSTCLTPGEANVDSFTSSCP